jgi:DNA-binding LacI/PurR family transcriptional regulator
MLMQGSLLALRDATIVVGQDISFVGDDAVAELHHPQIAVVRRDIPEVGAAAADLLLAELLGPSEGLTDETPKEIILPTEFIARASCAAVR